MMVERGACRALPGCDHHPQGQGAARRMVLRHLARTTGNQARPAATDRHRGADRGDRSAHLRRRDRRLLASARSAHPGRRRPGGQPGRAPPPSARSSGSLPRRSLALCPQPHGGCGAGAGLDAIDGPYFNFADTEGYHHEAAWSATLGCVGKWAIHPSQIAAANEVFAPTEAEIEFARQMCSAYESGASAGAGASGTRGIMVDAASVRVFKAVLERARLTGRG